MRLARTTAGWLLALLLLIVIGIHVYAQVFRWRAEHLLAELKTLRVEATPATTVLKLRREYASSVTDHGACSEDHCAFWIELTEWKSLILLRSKHPWSERPRYYLVGALRFFGLRLNYLMVNLSVEKGKLRGMNVWLIPMSYGGNGFLSDFSIHARTVSNFRRSADMRRVYAHPNLLVWKPDACTGCSGAMSADFTWQASQEEVERALGFDLSCITRFHDCRTPEEFLPTAAQLLKQDEAQRLAGLRGKIPCDKRMARILGRDSDAVGLVRIKKVNTDGKDRIVDYDLVNVLKGKNLPVSTVYYHPEQLPDTSEAGSDPLSRPLIQVGTERIIFLSEILGQPTPESNCAMMASSIQNLNAALEGIADDRIGHVGEE